MMPRRQAILITNSLGMLGDAWRGYRKLRFLTVGVWNTAFAYLAYLAVYMLLHRHFHYLMISVLTHILAVTNAFICQRRLVFRSHAPWWPAFARFNIVQLVILCWGLIGIAFMVEIVHLQPVLSQLIVMAVAIIGSYVLNRGFAFRM